MCFRFSRFGSVSFLPLLATSLLVCDAPAADAQRGRPIEFSDPKGSAVATNLNTINSKRGGLREFEDELTKPFQSRSSPGGSLDGVYIPPPQSRPGPAVSGKKFREAKDALERKRLWFLGDPDDMLNGPSMAEILKIREYDADGKEKKPLSPVEAYYERQERQMNGGIDSRDRDRDKEGDRDPNRKRDRDRDELAGAKRHPGLPDDSDEKDDAERPKEKGQSERDLRGLLDPRPLDSSFITESARSTASDIFGLGVKPSSSEQVEAEKNLRQQYGQFLSSFTTPASVAGPPSSLSGVADVRPVPTISAFESAPISGSSGVFDSSPATLSSTFGLPDSGVKGLGSLDSVSVIPKAEPFKMAPPSSAFEVPHRKF